LLGDLELNRTARHMLANRRSISVATADADLVDPQRNEIASSKLAVDNQVEHGEITFPLLDLETNPDRPDVLQPQ
jgi:hypothetical protein